MARSYSGKTRSFRGLKALRDLVSDSMAIDMGSSSTIIGVRGRGVVVDEPSVVAIDKITGEVDAVGQEAQNMLGREAREIAVIAPLVDGVVADFERTSAMLDQFVRAARSGISHFSRRAVMSVLTGVTHVEQRALLAAAEQAHIGRVYMVEEGLASALGAGVGLDDPRGSVVVDIGGSTTNIAAVANGTIVHAHAERMGGFDINKAIIDHVRRHHGISVGLPTAERCKIELGSATVPLDLGKTFSVKGRDVQTASPGAVDLTAGELYSIMSPVINRIASAVKETLGEMPPEIAADVYDRGLILSGGGALLYGMEEFLQKETKLLVRTAEEPRYTTVNGLMQLFDEPLLLRRVTRNEPRPFLEADADAFGT